MDDQSAYRRSGGDWDGSFKYTATCTVCAFCVRVIVAGAPTRSVPDAGQQRDGGVVQRRRRGRLDGSNFCTAWTNSLTTLSSKMGDFVPLRFLSKNTRV